MVTGEGKNKTVREKSPSKDLPALPKKKWRREGEILEVYLPAQEFTLLLLPYGPVLRQQRDGHS